MANVVGVEIDKSADPSENRNQERNRITSLIGSFLRQSWSFFGFCRPRIFQFEHRRDSASVALKSARQKSRKTLSTVIAIVNLYHSIANLCLLSVYEKHRKDVRRGSKQPGFGPFGRREGCSARALSSDDNRSGHCVLRLTGMHIAFDWDCFCVTARGKTDSPPRKPFPQTMSHAPHTTQHTQAAEEFAPYNTPRRPKNSHQRAYPGYRRIRTINQTQTKTDARKP